MKNLNFIYLLAFITVLISCENQEIDFPDYDYTTVYFPHQYPLRTISLGEDRINNDLDQNLQFHIAPIIGGQYKNTQNWNVGFEVDESLIDSLYTDEGNVIQALPASYYTLNPTSNVTIPAGDIRGMIEVQLTEAFLDDTLSYQNVYVVPLRITNTDADSILTGVSLVDNPNRHRVADYDGTSTPRDFTLFGVKFVNKYHGTYLRRGAVKTYDGGNNLLGEYVYRETYVERDEEIDLTTSGRYSVVFTSPRKDTIGSGTAGNFDLELTFNNDETASVLPLNDTAGFISTSLSVSNGTFVPDGDEWGNKKRNAIYLQYEYSENGYRHLVNDTMVFRDRGITYEELPIIKPE